jgi:hypothetical protein
MTPALPPSDIASNHGTGWLTQIIHFLCTECRVLWSLQNDARHIKEEDGKLARRYEQSRQETTECWLYCYKEECLPAHQADIRILQLNKALFNCDIPHSKGEKVTLTVKQYFL